MPDMTSNNLDRHKKKVLEGKTVLDFFFVIIIILLQQSREIHFPIWRCAQTPLLKLEVISLHHPCLGLLQSQNNSLRPLPSPPIILFIHIHLYPSLPQTVQSHSIDPSSWMKQQSTALLSLLACLHYIWSAPCRTWIFNFSKNQMCIFCAGTLNNLVFYCYFGWAWMAFKKPLLRGKTEHRNTWNVGSKTLMHRKAQGTLLDGINKSFREHWTKFYLLSFIC